MPYERYVKNTKILLQMRPLSMPAEEAEKCASYRSRRFLPNLISLLGLTPTEAASLGNWKNLPSGAPKQSEAKDIAASMPVRYDSSKLQLTVRVKTMCVQALAKAVQHADSYDLKWCDLGPLLPPVDELRKQTERCGEGLVLKQPTQAATRPFPLRPPGKTAASKPDYPTKPPADEGTSDASESTDEDALIPKADSIISVR